MHSTVKQLLDLFDDGRDSLSWQLLQQMYAELEPPCLAALVHLVILSFPETKFPQILHSSAR